MFRSNKKLKIFVRKRTFGCKIKIKERKKDRKARLKRLQTNERTIH